MNTIQPSRCLTTNSEWCCAAIRPEYSSPTKPPGDFFGLPVALSGAILAVGAGEEDSRATGINGDGADDGAPDSGTVYVFERLPKN